MGKFYLLILILIINSTKCSLDDCKAIDTLSCEKLETEHDIPEEYDKLAFQTPPRNDALGHYVSTYQDMRYLVGWAEYNYNEAKTRCTIKFHTKVNPDLGTKGEQYEIYYTFGDFEEQESNEITLNSRDDSYPNGLSASCRIINLNSGNEVVSLKLQNIYFMWDNVEVDTPEVYKDGQRGSIVELFGWSMEDVGEECEFLGIAGYLGVKIFSPQETILSSIMTEGQTLNPWWYGTQIVSFKYDARSGNQKQLKKITQRCRSHNVRVYAEIVINHMTGDGNDVNPYHYNGDAPPCNVWGPKPGSGGSPFYNTAFQVQNNYYTNQPPGIEYPAVPYFPSDFHCSRSINNWDDPFELCFGYLAGLQDVNTEKEYPQRRIATYIVDLLSIGVSGVTIANGRHIPNYDWAKIFKYVKEYLGNKLPTDFFAIIILENASVDMIMCDGEGYLDFGDSLTTLLKREGFKDSEILQIKFWFKGCLAGEDDLGKYEPSCGAETDSELKFDVQRWTVSLEYSDDINKGDTGYNIYIKHQNIQEHKNILINNMFLNPRFNYAIRFVFTSYSVADINGVPDGKSERSFCSSQSCFENTVDLPFKRAFNPHSRGYDCGNADNWIIGEYTRIHRDIDIINAMRKWLYSTEEKKINNTELYTTDELKAVCDEKCLICNEESKRLDKCIFCDSNNDYYPVMEIEGQEEYYQCYKKTSKVERFYFSNRDKAFLPCYETCKYCNEKGDINDHKCTACDYGLTKKPGTKELAITFNCVTECPHSYYYTESGQYKCTQTSFCPSDNSIYIKLKQKCVSSCKDEAPYIYLYNGNCVQECPAGYVPDDVNNLCKLAKNECTLGTRSESYSYLYSASMINSLAKGYWEEFDYTNKYILKIVNSNFFIYIFKDFDCVKELGLDIPDLRNTTNRRLEENSESLPQGDTCYTKVKKSLDNGQDIIVVYLEDTSNLISEKGYLLYNGYNGAKTAFETICGEEALAEKNDTTVDEDSENKIMKYVYLRPATANVEGGPTSCPEGEAPLYRNQIIDYSKCLAKGQDYEGLFYDARSDMFIPCHENCKYCSRSGSSSENNCLECAYGYIKNPLDGRTQNYNCVAECTYSYFFSSTGAYTCTPGPTCPKNYRYFIKEKNQCIDSCKNDDVYINTYNGNCIIECPEGYKPDDNGFCIQEVVDPNACTYTKKETTLRNFDDEGGLDTLVTNYFEEYYYTDRHVSEYNSSEYNILIYVQKKCLTELNLNFPVVDFGSCYDKVQEESNLNQSLIVVLLKKLDIKTGRTSSSYSLYDPRDATKLDAANICKDEEIVVEESVLEILEQSGINYESLVFLTDQNIDVFDSSGAFYTDICYDFDSPVDRDITLEDRLETFYPNVSLCDPGCQSKGVNLTTMKAICSCSFNDISNAGIVGDIEYLNQIFEIISSSNIQVLKCMKFMFKRFGSSVGGFLMLFCIIFVFFMGLIFYLKDLDIIKKYIITKTTAYIAYLNEAFPDDEEKKTDIMIESVNDKVKDSKVSKESKESKDSRDISRSSDNSNSEQKQNSRAQKGEVLLLNKINNSKEILTNTRKLNNNVKTLRKTKTKTKEKDTGLQNFEEYEDFNQYLAPDVDDQEFDDVITQDKRTFKEYFMDSLNSKQLFVNTFNVVDNFRPKSLKLVLFVLTLILYCVINGLFYGDDAISEIYHIEGDDPFFGFFPRSITRYIYSAVVGIIIGVIIDLFFVDEKKMKRIFSREKSNIVNLKVQITKLSKGIALRYIAFVIFVLVLFILLMFYLLCFNYVYPHTQGEWVKSSIFLIILMQILSILVCLLETGLRFISFKTKSEKLYKLSRLLE